MLERERLSRLLVALFGETGLKEFIEGAYPAVRVDIAFDRAAPNQLAFDFIERLALVGLLDAELRRKLKAAKPDHQQDIDDVWRGREPAYASDEERTLGETLEALYEQRAALKRAGLDARAVTEKILAIRRRQREGPKLLPGDRLSERYKLLRVVGSGGYGTVWAAYDAERRRDVAVKVLHGHHAVGGEREERFFRGARWMERLNHPHLVRVLQAKGHDGGYRYFVMEFVPGGDLKPLILDRALSQNTVLDHIEAIAEALKYAHRQQPPVIHRDVKPSNILLDADGTPKLSDFDLVRVDETSGGTGSGGLGTFVYGCPEALKDASKAGGPADVYGLAMTAYVALAGREPGLEGKSQPEALVDELYLHQALRDVLVAGLQLRPADRPADAGVFLDALRAARRQIDHDHQISHLQGSASVQDDPWANIPIPPPRAFWLGAGVVAAALLLLVARGEPPGWPLTSLATGVDQTQTFRREPQRKGTTAVERAVPEGMVEVSAGKFLMGCNETVDTQCCAEERPSRTVDLPTFYIDRTEVTVAAFDACIEAKKCRSATVRPGRNCNLQRPDRADHPINCVSWHGANAFCRSLGKRLPTDAEWEKAARGTRRRDRRTRSPTLICGFRCAGARRIGPPGLFSEPPDERPRSFCGRH